MITPDEIKADLAIIEGAMPGPWQEDISSILRAAVGPRHETFSNIIGRDAELIAAARNRWPLYIEEYQALRSAHQTLTEQLSHVETKLLSAEMQADHYLAGLEQSSEEIHKLRAVAEAASEFEQRTWFDPKEKSACMFCDANLHENCMEVHVQLNGEPCPAQVLHDSLAAWRSGTEPEGSA